MRKHLLPILGLSMATLWLGACTPTVQLAAPSEPITINLNVKVEHEVLVRVDKQIDTLLEENSELF